jgi:competence protein ComGC
LSVLFCIRHCPPESAIVQPYWDTFGTRDAKKQTSQARRQKVKRAYALWEIVLAVAVGMLVVIAIVLAIVNIRKAKAETNLANAQTAVANHVQQQLSAPDAVIQDEKNLNAIATSMEEYAIDHSNRYPTSIQELGTAGGGIYVPKGGMPVDPVNGNPYRLLVPGPSGANYEIEDAGGLSQQYTSDVPGGPGSSLRFIGVNPNDPHSDRTLQGISVVPGS